MRTGTQRRVDSLAKIVTWRVVATATTFVVTGNLLVGAPVGGIDATAQLALDFVHERA